jgi:glycerol-3-phosphate O-acyltransferase / dihydroxyacetone phosphate acyltransferase
MTRADRLLHRLARLILTVFFRRVETSGIERIPTGRPLLLVANHVNGLVDPLLLVGPMPVMPRFLAKSTLWDIPVLSSILDAARAVPVYRRHDPGVDPADNASTFERCHELLAAGGTIAMFPEGVSHNEPAVLPLKTGAARIVLEAERRFGPLGTRIVPVGLHYDQKTRFRSRVLVQVGEPIDPLASTGAREAVRDLTERIGAGLDAVTLSYRDWDEARRIARAADLYDRPRLDVPRRRGLSEELGVRRGVLEAYGALSERHPERVAAVSEAVQRYDDLLEAVGLRDEHVAAEYAPEPVLRFLTHSLGRLLLTLPPAVVGTVLNYLPYRLVGFLAGWVAHLPDQQATYKIFPALLAYPAFWLGEAALAGWAVARHGPPGGPGWHPWAAAGLTLLLAPVTGWVALRFHETRRWFRDEARAFLVLRTRRSLQRELARRRAAVLEEIDALEALYEAS